MTGWAVLGVGRFGGVHAEVLATLPGAELLALCGRRDERLQEVRQSVLALGCADVALSNDYLEVLGRPDVEAVSITSHWHDHCELAVAALEHGKHVLLEKPMAASRVECERILAAHEQSPAHLMVGHVCRFDPRVVLAREAICAGRLGRIVSMHARRNLPVAPGSIRLDKIPPLMGDGIHDADLMMWFLQRSPDQVYARTIQTGAHQYPDLGWAMLQFGDDAVGVVETVWCLPKNVPTAIDAELRVVGTEGTLTIDCGRAGLAVLDHDGLRLPDTVYWPKVHGRRTGALGEELAYFQRCIKADIPPEVITPSEAARAVVVMEAAEHSAREQQVVAIEF